MDALIKKSHELKLSDTQVTKFMRPKIVTVTTEYSIKATIDLFRLNNISGAPVVDKNGIIIGIISEYDLLIQAASKNLKDKIEFNTKVSAVNENSTLKDILIILYKNKLKIIPVINSSNHVLGMISRIDILAFISDHQ
jgi:IMP dehydrogenase